MKYLKCAKVCPAKCLHNRASRVGYRRGVFWSPPYFAAAPGGAPIIILKDYTQQQKTPFEPFEGPYIPILKEGALRPPSGNNG